MVYNKAWFNDMTMVLLHNHISMTVQNLTSHLIKLINFYYLKFYRPETNDIHAIIMCLLSLGIQQCPIDYMF